MTHDPKRLRTTSELAHSNRLLVAELQETIDKIAASVKAGKEQIARNEASDHRSYPSPYQAPEEPKP